MESIFQTIYRNAFSSMKIVYLIQIPLKFVQKVPIDNRSALVKMMAWHKISDKPLSGPMTVLFTGVCMRLSVSIG